MLNWEELYFGEFACVLGSILVPGVGPSSERKLAAPLAYVYIIMLPKYPTQKHTHNGPIGLLWQRNNA